MNTPDNPDTPTPRKPALPSSGGLLGRHFVYRPATQTDVRLTWQRVKKLPQAQQPPAS